MYVAMYISCMGPTSYSYVYVLYSNYDHKRLLVAAQRLVNHTNSSLSHNLKEQLLLDDFPRPYSSSLSSMISLIVVFV